MHGDVRLIIVAALTAAALYGIPAIAQPELTRSERQELRLAIRHLEKAARLVGRLFSGEEQSL